jgi:hypothetical protein
MSGAIPPLPQYAFMAWYSVKAQGKLYLYLTQLEDLGVYGKIILDWIFGKSGGKVWTGHLAQDRNQCRVLVNTVMNLRVP